MHTYSPITTRPSTAPLDIYSPHNAVANKYARRLPSRIIPYTLSDSYGDMGGLIGVTTTAVVTCITAVGVVMTVTTAGVDDIVTTTGVVTNVTTPSIVTKDTTTGVVIIISIACVGLIVSPTGVA